jgi:hypothetical protein
MGGQNGKVDKVVARWSAADRRHRPRRPAVAGLADPMLQLLAPDGVADHALELRIARPAAKRLAQVDLVDREQAGPELAVDDQRLFSGGRGGA